MTPIDFRSDTVAMPSPEMRKAMVEAPLGDDVFGDDPTTNRLLEVAAARMGKETATFVPSGTMGNLIGVAVSARRGEELIADADSHVFHYETAGAAAVCGVQIRPIATEAGVMSPHQIVAAIRPHDDPHQPLSAAVTFENTHNRHGGIVWPGRLATQPTTKGFGSTSTERGSSTPRWRSASTRKRSRRPRTP